MEQVSGSWAVVQLVINTFGASIRKEGERFVLRAGDKRSAVSVHKVHSILITTGAHLSTDAVQLAVEHSVDIVFLDKFGDPYGRVWHCRMGSTAAIRRRQIEAANGDEGLQLVVEWTRVKARSQRELLEQLQKRRPERAGDFDSALATLADMDAKLEGIEGSLDERRDSIMGYEGTGESTSGC